MYSTCSLPEHIPNFISYTWEKIGWANKIKAHELVSLTINLASNKATQCVLCVFLGTPAHHGFCVFLEAHRGFCVFLGTFIFGNKFVFFGALPAKPYLCFRGTPSSLCFLSFSGHSLLDVVFRALRLLGAHHNNFLWLMVKGFGLEHIFFWLPQCSFYSEISSVENIQIRYTHW